MNTPTMAQRFGTSLSDTATITWRNLKRVIRTPQLLVFSSIQPVMFLLLFNYVFGGAVQGAGTGTTHYINFLIPGILAQTALFGSLQTGVGLTEDLGKGVIDRFRSLPMARSAVLAGRTLADAGRNLVVLLLLFAVGTLLGFRWHNGNFHLVEALGLMLLFGYSFSWISATLGLLVKNSEAMQTVGFLWVFPFVFASSVFVPLQTMPKWLQVFARNQPVTQVVNAVRALTQGGDLAAVWHTLVWVVIILVIFVTISINRYRKIA